MSFKAIVCMNLHRIRVCVFISRTQHVNNAECCNIFHAYSILNSYILQYACATLHTLSTSRSACLYVRARDSAATAKRNMLNALLCSFFSSFK